MLEAALLMEGMVPGETGEPAPLAVVVVSRQETDNVITLPLVTAGLTVTLTRGLTPGHAHPGTVQLMEVGRVGARGPRVLSRVGWERRHVTGNV